MALSWDFLASALRLRCVVFLLHLHALFQNVSPLDVTPPPYMNSSVY